jgi:hypothetical protein
MVSHKRKTKLFINSEENETTIGLEVFNGAWEG